MIIPPMTTNDSFRFKQFEVRHHHCAHKVGFDGVLLGAWTDSLGKNTILDVGTGSGLIALMLAQKNQQARIIGIDSDAASLLQAEENFKKSIFSRQLQTSLGNILEYNTPEKFDLIVCNPPYFIESNSSPDQRRADARSISPAELQSWFARFNSLLKNDGCINLVLPSGLFHLVNGLFLDLDINLIRKTDVITKGENPHRVLLEYSRKNEKLTTNSLFVYDSFPEYSQEYRKLTQDFYLDF